jgi:hypothetical protein
MPHIVVMSDVTMCDILDMLDIIGGKNNKDNGFVLKLKHDYFYLFYF